jgi:hypothetical protein
MHPNWPLTTPIALGDIGLIEKGRFIRRTDLGNLGIKFKRNSRKAQRLLYQTGHGVTIASKLGGHTGQQFAAVAQADAGIRVGFAKEGALVVAADGCREIQIEDQELLLTQLQAPAAKWKKKWVVVTHVLVAKTAMLLVSGSSNANIEFRISADLGSDALVRLARADAGLAVATRSDMATEIFADQGLQLMYLVSEVHKPFLGGDRTLRGRAPAKKAAPRKAPAKKAAAKKAPAKKAAAKKAPARKMRKPAG